MPVLPKLVLVAGLGVGAKVLVGGWATVTITNPPAYLESGQSYRLEYMVRQHGRDPLAGLSGTVELLPTGAAPAGGPISVAASAGSRQGSYVATFRVPEGDRLTLKIRSGFSGGGWGDLTVTGIPLVRRGERAPVLSPADRGRQLFVMKGCVRCHVNGDLSELPEENRVLERGAAPELTGRKLEAAYVRQRLTDPASLPAIGPGPLRMPNLELAPAEVDALVAMLTGR
ncbi:MAG: hypothetical protein U0133_08130 [Gemmatimonadales bacterium]